MNISEVSPHLKERHCLFDVLRKNLIKEEIEFEFSPICMAIAWRTLAYMPSNIDVYMAAASAEVFVNKMAWMNKDIYIKHFYWADTKTNTEQTYVIEIGFKETEDTEHEGSDSLTVIFHQIKDFKKKYYTNCGEVLTELLNVQTFDLPLVATAVMLAESTDFTTIQHLNIIDSLIFDLAKMGDLNRVKKLGSDCVINQLYCDERFMDSHLADFFANSSYWGGICYALKSHRIDSSEALQDFMSNYIRDSLIDMHKRIKMLYERLAVLDDSCLEKSLSDININKQSAKVEPGLYLEWSLLADDTYTLI